jgi:hypothetical protein
MDQDAFPLSQHPGDESTIPPDGREEVQHQLLVPSASSSAPIGDRQTLIWETHLATSKASLARKRKKLGRQPRYCDNET